MGLTLKKYIWILGVLCTVMISYLLAKITTLFVEGAFFPDAVITASATFSEGADKEAQLAKEVDIDVILKRNFFDAKETALVTGQSETDTKQDTPPDTDTTTVPDKPLNDKAVRTSLNIKLYSAISVGDGRNAYSSCVIKTAREMETFTLKSKDPFGAQTKITRILAKKVEFINNGQLEFVDMEDFAAKMDMSKKKTPDKEDVVKVVTKPADETGEVEIKREGDNFQIPRSEINKALENINQLYTDIRAVPYFKEGKPQGFKLLSVKRGSLFQQLGLRRGDILVAVNGKVLDIQSGMETFNTLKSETEFKLQLERRNEEKTFSYQIIE